LAADEPPRSLTLDAATESPTVVRYGDGDVDKREKATSTYQNMTIFVHDCPIMAEFFLSRMDWPVPIPIWALAKIVMWDDHIFPSLSRLLKQSTRRSGISGRRLFLFRHYHTVAIEEASFW
jgi:hypothetical protein